MVNCLKKWREGALSLVLLSLSYSCAHKVGTQNSNNVQNELAAKIVTEASGKASEIAPVNEPEDQQEVKLTQSSYQRIQGSSRFKKNELWNKKSYFLYGAEHLNLKNYYFDIPVSYNAAVKKWMKYFLQKGRGFFERYSNRAGRYAPIIGKMLEDQGMPRDLIFLAMAESGFRNNAKSHAWAVGPWQFIKSTGKRFKLKQTFYLDERRDPIKATLAASQYLRMLYNDFGSWELAAAAYNAGEGKINRAIRRYGTENFWRLRKGRYLKSETKNYVPKIMALAIIGKNLSSFGFKNLEFDRPLDFDEIFLPPMTDLYHVANGLGMDIDEVRKWNPELLRWVTPPGTKLYPLRVPVGKKKEWEMCCWKKDFMARDFQIHRVRGYGENLKRVARRLRVPVNVLKELNNISIHKRLKKGTQIITPFRVGQGRRISMYSDLYERRRGRSKRSRWRRRVRLAKRRGRKIANPTQYYRVKRGDTLWHVAQRHGVSLDTLIVSNLNIINYRSIREGDSLVVR